jgi:sensor histidine kinase YesM
MAMNGAEKGKKNKSQLAADLAFTLVINFTVAVVITFVFVYRAGNFGGFGTSLLASLIVSNSIGLLVLLVLTLVDTVVESRPPLLKWTWLVCGLVVATAVGFLIGSAILTVTGLLDARYLWASFRYGIGFSLLITLIIGLGIYVYENLRAKLEAATSKLREKELAEERARKLAIEARLSSLESRIHPHFLFNTLNSISSLIQEDPQQAERMVERLAALLRFSLDSNDSGTVPLSQEMKIVKDYLEIEKARFGERLRYSIDLPAELEGAPVPPLSVQTLVENSLKHAVSRMREGGEVRVSARADDGTVRIEVSDDGPGFAAGQVMAGHGLDNLQSRLAALFDGVADLSITSAGGRTRVAFRVPQSQPQAAAVL